MTRLTKQGKMNDKWKLLFTIHLSRFTQFFLLNHMTSLGSHWIAFHKTEGSFDFLRIK